MLNQNLSIANFYKLRKSDQGGFAKWRIGTLPKGMLLFKLTTMARRRRRYTASHPGGPR